MAGDYFSAVTVVAAAGFGLALALTGFVGVGTGVAGVAGPIVNALYTGYFGGPKVRPNQQPSGLPTSAVRLVCLAEAC